MYHARFANPVWVLSAGYLVFYTTDATQEDRDWVVEGVMGDRLSTTIRDLTPETTYYFKVQARNSKGYGPMSPTVIFRTPRGEQSDVVEFDGCPIGKGAGDGRAEGWQRTVRTCG